MFHVKHAFFTRIAWIKHKREASFNGFIKLKSIASIYSSTNAVLTGVYETKLQQEKREIGES